MTEHDPRPAAADLLAAYALNALEPEEVALVDDALAGGDPELQQEVRALQRVASALPLAAPLVDPPATLRDRVMSAVQPAPSRSAAAHFRRAALPFRRTERYAAMAASVAVLAAAGLLGWNVLLHDRVGELADTNSDLQAAVDVMATAQDQSKAALSATDARLQETQAMTRDLSAGVTDALFSLTAPDTRAETLSRTAQAPAANARLIWNPSDQLFILVVTGLSATLDDSAYVVWLETAEGVQKMGHFYVDESGRGLMHGYLTDLDLEDARRMTITKEADPAQTQRPSAPVLLLNR